MADFGYDVADHTDVHPMFGTLADLDALVDAAHARDLRVILDFVPNHTSDRHAWFVASRSSRGDPRRDWYVWRDPGPDGGPPNNWMSRFGGGPAWTFDEPTGQWYLHTFLPEQPDLNWRTPAVREAMCDVLRFWMDRGIDGFRVDVAHRIMKDADLRDNPSDPRSATAWRASSTRSRRPPPTSHGRRGSCPTTTNRGFPTRIGRACARQALVFLLTARGTAVLYYGDELTLGLHEAAVLAPASAP